MDQHSEDVTVFDETPSCDTLTEQEMRRLVIATIEGQPGRSATEQQFERVHDWARTVRCDAVLLEMVLDGDLKICLKDNEILFRTPVAEEAEEYRQRILSV